MQHSLEEVVECASADSGILLGALHGVRLPTASLAVGKDANLVPIHHTAGQQQPAVQPLFTQSQALTAAIGLSRSLQYYLPTRDFTSAKTAC